MDNNKILNLNELSVICLIFQVVACFLYIWNMVVEVLIIEGLYPLNSYLHNPTWILIFLGGVAAVVNYYLPHESHNKVMLYARSNIAVLLGIGLVELSSYKLF